ncbi:lysophospholipid acyltransferase family protein [Parvularcula oceani]|uniref:lysophospholipid acyltransferase family protein n=1 Tax=Parvularcula oceani TaxID=1247963 RepID=UPI000690308C|nr:lysophospholipid acyltransferase family protein [Parvularcula oceani]
MARKKSLSPLLLAVLPPLVAGYIRLVHGTVRWERIGDEHHRALIGSGQPFICAFWHSRLLMMPVIKAEQGRDFRMLISEHRDGEVIARVIGHFGIDTARGSAADPRKRDKNKGGAAALKALISSGREGRNTGITPDGPRGPRQRAQPGIAQLARLSGLPVLPMSYSVRRARFLGSWDRFLLPLPFSRGVFAFGEPVRIGGRGPEALERGRTEIEEELNRITAACDRMMGHEEVAPARFGAEMAA